MSPATVATSANYDALRYPPQRKGFYAVGLFWAFYHDDASQTAGWKTSPDGTTWTGDYTSIGAARSGEYFSVWFDGTYVHYALTDIYGTWDLFYRRGTPVSNGTISWSAAQQTVHNGSSVDNHQYPCIAVDTNGYAWIGAHREHPNGGFNEFPVILKNANNNGTWATDFATELSAVDTPYWTVAPIPLTDGKVYVIYCRYGAAPLGKLYDAGWGAEENGLADFAIDSEREFSAVAIGDNVHFIYNRDTTNQIRHNERVWGVGWNASDVLVQDNLVWNTAPALSADPYTGGLYCFWTKTHHVYYKQYTAGTWRGLVNWIDESTDDIGADDLINSFYTEYGGYIGLLYVTKLASPYNVRFAFFSPSATTVTTQYEIIFGE